MKGRACGGTSDLQRGFAVNMTPGFSCIFTFPASRHLGKRQVSVGYGLFHLSWWKLQFIHLKSGDKSGSSFFRIMRLPSLGWDGPVPCRMLSSIPGLQPLDASRPPPAVTTNNIFQCWQLSPGCSSPRLKIPHCSPLTSWIGFLPLPYSK